MNVLFDTLFDQHQHRTYTIKEAFDIFHAHSIIAHGELAEQAISKATGIEQCPKNTPGIDLVNGLQIKHALTNYETQAYQGRLKGHISKRNHTETIMAVVTETVTDCQYYFEFPYESYRHHKGNSFAIPFDLDGTPRRDNPWWRYEIPSWELFQQRIEQFKSPTTPSVFQGVLQS